MNEAAYNSAKPLILKKHAIDEAQAAIAVTGTKVKIVITNTNGTQVTVDDAALIRALGQTAYNTLIASTKTAVSAALTSEETATDTALAAL